MCVLLVPSVEDRQLVRFTRETKHHVAEVVIKSLNFGIYLIHRIKHIQLALLFPPLCYANRGRFRLVDRKIGNICKEI